ncbi:hypothetical protein DT070_06415 [Polaromonas sp. SP1]|uniref:AsmA-like C-terminal region-containing protein n=1 Tax=Polaromonas sp. SP1 TaxID=2268087 RepID=UPI000F084DA8|nr:AsmA-like C-terminal region-containing protein [Polaromonas sp. SP1]AYQ27691.1 hypothetical protein DT070_06415 [Polaromonas sp. SP1]
MKRGHKWLAALGVVVLLAGAAWVAALRYLPSDEELAQRASAELETALGVKVRVGALHWRLFPSPAVVMEDAATDQPQPILIKKLTAYPDLFALLQRRIKIDRADLDGATVPQLSLRGLGKGGEAKESSGEELPLARFVFRDVTWITRRGIPAVYEGDVDFDPGWRPRRAELRRPGAKDPTQLTLARNGQDDRWAVRIQVGGGTAHGDVQLDTRAGGRLHLEGKLQPKDIEVESMMSAFNRRSPIGGRVSGDTTLTANGDTVGELAQSLHTQTLFSMGKSTLLRFDLDKAVRTAGKEHDGQTPLESITGRLDTQNTPQGMVVTYTGVKAASGSLTASGEAKIANRRIEGEFAVDLVDGIVGVPLTVSGPLDDVKFSVPSGAIAGAVVGTAVLPGVGTAIGARIGATLGKIFSPGPAAPASAPSRAARPAPPAKTR